MSHAESAVRATQWLTDLVGELSGLRNATSRDPSFKNWRQNAITTTQRIWPADQDHAERFRRIPFSPVDPRADVRAQRESFSRGCQEAARVLNSFIEEIRASGVPESGAVQQTEESGFVDGFPTVDLPSGDLGGAGNSQDEEREGMTPQGADPRLSSPGLRTPQPQQTPSGSEARPARKGFGVAAKLRDLLGLTGFAAKPAPPPPAHGTGSSGTFQAQPSPSLDIVPVGDEVDARPRVQRPQVTPWPSRPGPTSGPPAPAAPAPAAPAPHAPPAGSGNPPPAEAGMSVVMSRPTTLRSTIGKVSIESLISPEFRGGAESAGATPPAPSTPPADPAAGRPPLSIVPPPAGDPEFDTDPEPPTPPAKPNKGDTPGNAARSSSPSKIVPLPLPPAAPARGMDARAAEPPADAAADAEAEESRTSSADSAEFARATEDFMRSSPVLGATGRKVQRAAPSAGEHGFTDPDAIAVMSLVEELTQLGVAVTRQSETRARLLDLARRMEANQVEWNALRKAVWFAMEYPEIARRLMPLLLPWIDRAA